jgi:hypothetical protein
MVAERYHMVYTLSMNTNGAGTQVDCRLTINGVTIAFTMAGPLVALAPAPVTTPKRTSTRGRK